jgi:hypothetical protein
MKKGTDFVAGMMQFKQKSRIGELDAYAAALMTTDNGPNGCGVFTGHRRS